MSMLAQRSALRAAAAACAATSLRSAVAPVLAVQRLASAAAAALPLSLSSARSFSKAAASATTAAPTTSNHAPALPALPPTTVTYVSGAAGLTAGKASAPLQAVALFITEEDLSSVLASARAHAGGGEDAALELDALLSAAGGGEPGSAGALFEHALTHAPSSAIWTDFSAKAGETVWLYPTAAATAKKGASARSYPRVLLVGLGAAAKVQLSSYRSATWKAISSFQSASLLSRVGVLLPQPPVLAKYFDAHLSAQICGNVARIAAISNHIFRRHLSPEVIKQRKKGSIAHIDLIDLSPAASSVTGKPARSGAGTKNGAAARSTTVGGSSDIDRRSSVRAQVVVAQAVSLARELANERGDVCTPAFMESQARALAALHKDNGLSVTVLQDAELAKEGLELIRAVGRGANAENKPRIVLLEYRGKAAAGASSASSSPTEVTALVGKGVTFDTGGLQIKGRGSIENMHVDMAGSAAVLAVMQALPQLGYQGHVVAALALAENAVSADSYKPLAILPSVKGSVEVMDTDAEGRLVLADAFTLIQRRFKPTKLIDLATLTGAAVVALGEGRAAVFANADPVAEGESSASGSNGGSDASSLTSALVSAGDRVGERLWRMPIDDAHRDEIKGNHSDWRNCAPGRWGGACVGAAFLEKFVEPNTAWAHLDIAGPAMRSKSAEWACEGGTGFGTALLLDYFDTQQRTNAQADSVDKIRQALANFKENGMESQQE
jgi:leucyl aminopeptidase